jgi:outer membrane protein assembly factor BamE (lipoprotein component of BamABCDE complex)
MKLNRTFLAANLWLSACVLSCGCLISGERRQIESGTKVSEATFSRIKPNQTTEDWVRATLGTPTTDTALRDGGRVLKWTYTERQESSGAVFLIFGGHDEKRITHTAYVELHDGVVTNAWRE